MPLEDRWVYEQSTGKLYVNEVLFSTGYSGAPGHVNRSDHENMVNKGPIPCGAWNIVRRHQRHPLGEYVLELKADSQTKTYGRSEFFIHGERLHATGKNASNGCIVFAASDLRKVFGSNMGRLYVMSQYRQEPSEDVMARAVSLLAQEIATKTAAAATSSKGGASAPHEDPDAPKCGAMPIPSSTVSAEAKVAKRLSNEYKDICVYSSSSGRFFLNGDLIAIGYSGTKDCLNKVANERMENRGPIPQGKWLMGRARQHPVLGQAIELTPSGHGAFNRTEFFIHSIVGDKALTASKGCIILTGRAVKWLADNVHKPQLVVVK